MLVFFNIGRGCRQGDTLSTYLFRKIKGIVANDEEFKVSQFADDTCYDMKAVTKKERHTLKMIRPRQDSNPGPLGLNSNALITEPKSRLPDAVVRDWLYT